MTLPNIFSASKMLFDQVSGERYQDRWFSEL